MPPVHPRWLARRQRLHAAFIEVCEPPDASWLPRMGRRQHRWSAADVARMWSRTPRRADAHNHVYVHVPFCKSICHFCNYERLRPSHPDQLRQWRDRVIGAVRALGPSTAGLGFHTLYFGGGTPSVLPADMVREVVGAIDDAFSFVPNANRLFELDPAVMNPKKAAAWGACGFQHASFGIQTLDPDVNERHERGRQDRALIGARFQDLRNSGIHDVSCDFLFGLAGTTIDGILSEVDEVLRAHRPRWIDVYQLIPTDNYVQRHFDGDREAFWSHLLPFQERGGDGLRRLAASHGYGFIAGQDHRFSLIRSSDQKKGHESPYSYTQLVSDQHRPLNLLAFGPSARSRIFGEAWMTCEDPDTPGAPAWWDGCLVDMDDESRCYLTYLLRDSDTVSCRDFQRIFAADLRVRARQGISAMLALDIATLTEDTLTLRPSNRRQRAADLLWLVDEQRIERELAKVTGFALDAGAMWRRLHPLQAGTALGEYTLAGVQDGRVLLHGHTGTITLRCTPPLPGGDGPGLVVESGVPTDAAQRASLSRSTRLLRRVLARS